MHYHITVRYSELTTDTVGHICGVAFTDVNDGYIQLRVVIPTSLQTVSAAYTVRIL